MSKVASVTVKASCTPEKKAAEGKFPHLGDDWFINVTNKGELNMAKKINWGRDPVTGVPHGPEVIAKIK